MGETFRKFAHTAAAAAGSAWAFLLAVAVVVVWAVCGPFLHYSENWQLTINTGTTIVTFLMVFLIQNAQNRDSKALHLKLDELLRANVDARNGLLDVEDLPDDALTRLQAEFARLCGDADDPFAPHAANLSGAVAEVQRSRAHRRRDGR